jgi:hypothetical protein
MTDVAVIQQIIDTHHFTNLHAENDRGFRETYWQIVHPCQDDPGLLLKLAIAVFTNQPDALRQIDWTRPADAEFLPYVKGVLKDYQTQGGSVFRTVAYKYPMPPEIRGMNALDCLFDVVLGPMQRALDELRPRDGDTLETVHIRLCGCHGVGEFLSGQIIRYLKYAEPLRSASDWETFVARGPGSERGLNLLYGRPITAKWSRPLFCAAIEKARQRINPELVKHGLAPLDGQNTNNLFCETFKLHRAIERGGKPSRPYKPSGKPMPPPIPGFSSRIETSIDATAQFVTDTETVPPHILEDQSSDTHDTSETHQSETIAKPLPPPADKPSAYPPHGSGNRRGKRDYGQRVTFYIYEDARSRFYLGVERTTTKQFPQYHWNGKQWIKGLPDGFLKIPYRLPALLDAPVSDWAVIAAGEKDAETAARLGFTATTNPGGEGKGQWTPELNKWFAGKQRAAIMEDNDRAGHAHAIEVANALRGVVPDIRIVQFRELNAGGDLTDWAEADPNRGHAELLARIEAAPAAENELDEEDAGELLSGDLPCPRGWLMLGQFCRGFLGGLVAPGDVGKTTLRLTQAIELATGRELLGMRLFGRRRVLFVCFEDDRKELHRRMLAIRKHHKIDPTELKGWLFFRAISRAPKLAELDDKGRRRVGPLDGILRRAIKRRRCDLLILDPFIKLHALEESSNPDMDFMCDLLIKIAQDHDIAVDSPAHTHKGAIVAGDADARRGASAQRDAGRLDHTFTVMSEDEAKQFGISADERRFYVRLDKAKANIVPAMKAHWFRLVSVQLGNANAEYPDGDAVQAIERWEPPATWAGIEPATLNAILDNIAAGMPDGQRYSEHGSAKDRAAWRVVRKHCAGKAEAQCRDLIKQWVKAEVLFTDTYMNPVRHEEEKGLFVAADKRPQY